MGWSGQRTSGSTPAGTSTRSSVVRDRHREDVLDRGAGPPSATLDARERQVAADHDEPAAAGDVVGDRGEAVRPRLRALERVGMEQQRVGADVAEDDRGVWRSSAAEPGKAEAATWLGR